MHSITFTLYQQLTKTTSIQKMDQAPQRCLKVMQNIKILKIKLGKIINDFEQNVSIKKMFWMKNGKLLLLRFSSFK
jgi:hypothetical protein